MIEAVVKSVLSADTLILAHPTKLPPVEKMVTLANINAPRYAKKAGDKEEPFAYMAREYVRQKCIGKIVRFEVSYSNPKTGRDFGHIYLGPNNDVESNLGYQLIERGLATLVKSRSDGTELQERMLDAFEKAQQAGRGIHTNDPNILRENTRQPKWDHINLRDIKKRFHANQTPMRCVVEHVLSGSTVVVQLNDSFENVLLHMTGIRCPRIRYKTVQEIGKDGKVVHVKRPDPEPLAQEARHFTEARLLNRDIVVYVDAVREDKHENSLIGSIVSSSNVQQQQTTLPRVHQEDLLQKGFARFIDYETYGSSFAKQLQRAEHEAKGKRLRIWKDYQEPESSLQKGDQQEIRARAVEILSGDKIRVRYLTPGREEELIALSCIRAPKMGAKNAQPEPWAVEAKEKLRSAIGGHKVSIKVDYRRPVKVSRTTTVDGEKHTETSEEDRKFATVRVKGKNVALPMVKSGLVSVIFRKFDEERSDDYGELKDTERVAINNKKGVHGNPKNAPKQFINDMSFKNLGEVQKFAPLILGKKVKAVVEKVHAAHRMKLFIPKHHCKITFTLSGISVPSVKSSDPEEAQIAQEGLDYAMDQLLLRDVEVDIASVNNVGNFLGNIFVKGKNNYVYDLIRQGFAEVRTGKFVDKLKNVQQLREAEAEGQQNEVGLYKNWREKRAQKQQEQEEEANPAPQHHNKGGEHAIKIHPDESGLHQIRVTEIVDVSHLYMQTSDAAQYLSKIDALMRQLDLSRTSSFPAPPKAGTLCFSKFSYDNAWYRAKVKSVQGDQATVVYIDFGNSEQVAVSDLRPVENNAITKELYQIPPQVKEVFLAFIAPPQDEYADDAYYFLSERIQDKDLYARLEFEDHGTTSNSPHKQYVTLYTNPDGTGNIQEELLKNGFACVNIPDYLKKKAYSMWLARKSQALVRAEELAKTVHTGIWERGEGF